MLKNGMYWMEMGFHDLPGVLITVLIGEKIVSSLWTGLYVCVAMTLMENITLAMPSKQVFAGYGIVESISTIVMT